jgi:trichoplein keratin filament-binding protein
MQHNSWTSDKSYKTSMNAYARQQEDTVEQKEEKKRLLKLRQEKLDKMLNEEKFSLENELKQLRISNASQLNPIGTGNIGVSLNIGNVSNRSEAPTPRGLNTVDALKQRAETLRSAREDERKKIAQEKLYEHWRVNNPELREIESKKLNNHVVNNWEVQIDEKNEKLIKEKEYDEEYVRYLEKERERALEKDTELKRLKLNRELELKEILKQQMIELKQREAENEILKREESELMQERIQMQQLDEDRKENEKKYENKEYGKQLLRQHTAKLRKKAKEIQEALEFDLGILRQLSESQENQRNVESAKRHKAKADAEYMIGVLQEQLRLEKQREAELDSLFADEAAREWEKRNAEWEREKVARERLMNEVLDERKKQIEEKYEIIQLKKIESLERREELIKDMEQTQRLAQKERDKMSRLKQEFKQDIDNQVITRREAFQHENIEKIKDFEEEQIENQMYNELVEQEKKREINTAFEPKVSHFFF